MGEKVLFTVGYGGRQPDDLIALLKEHGITDVIDVRRNSKSYLHTYRTGKPIQAFLNKHHIDYLHMLTMGNEYATLVEYGEWLETSAGQQGVKCLASFIQIAPKLQYCLLCTEKRAYACGGVGLPTDPFVVECHRVYVADAVVKLLGEEWEVKHL